MSLFKSQPRTADQDKQSLLIELLYAGNAIALYLQTTYGALSECICSKFTTNFQDPLNHESSCPVAHYYAAVDAVKKAVL